jgi:hypothetical protein
MTVPQPLEAYMADQSMSVSGPVTVKSDSKERVAFELMNAIARMESAPKDRTYYLTLFSQCLQVANGTGVQFVEPKV